MDYVILCLIGVFGGGFSVFIALDRKRKSLDKQKHLQDSQEERIRNESQAIAARQQELDQRTKLLAADESKFRARAVSYQELQGENAIVKRDLKNLDVAVRKLQLDRDLQRHKQDTLDERSKELGSRYLKENVKWIGSSLNATNFTSCKQRLLEVIERCRGIGFPVGADEETALLANLKEEYELAVRAAFEREEQARIRAQIREEQKRDREIQREQERLERERTAIQAALDKALAISNDQHSAEIESLRASLAEAESKQRAISQAQLTKAGHIYVISNIGSFGDGVFKIGMTRRLEPKDRVRELGDASVPFPFDIHMMISCDNAPTLEAALHRALHKSRLNRANPRREFFKTDVPTICQIVKEHHGDVQYVVDAEALQYHQSLTMPDEDQAFIESVYDKFEDDEELVEEEV